ncbi:MAG: VOC family protein [Caulobacteraceae bacterium]
MGKAIFDQIDIVARDMAASLAFYQLAGVEMRDPIPEGAPPHHVHADQPAEGADLEFDSHALARVYNQGFDPKRARAVIGLKLEGRQEVDEAFERLILAGHRGLQVPYDAFWGARYAIVEDPDGNPVGLMSPLDPTRRSAPQGL